MSGMSSSQNCPYCDGVDTLMTYDDWKPHNSSCGECVLCGYAYYTQDYQMTLAETNEIRENYGLKPLKKLAKSSYEAK